MNFQKVVHCMHPIEKKLLDSFARMGYKDSSTSEADFLLSSAAIKEHFTSLTVAAFNKSFLETREPGFRLRMSNIGRPLRQLMLEKKLGRPAPSPEFLIKMGYGNVVEALFLTAIQFAGFKSVQTDKKGYWQVDADTRIDGTLDLILAVDEDDVEGVWDVKSCSDWSYKNKFVDFSTVEEDDAFGYVGQGFGYALAENKPFRGWLVINKSTGQFKVVELPDKDFQRLLPIYKARLTDKIKYINNDGPIPPCDGVVREFFRKKETGNLVLNRSCEWCPYKEHCHPGIQCLPNVNSDAKEPKMTWYVKLVNKIKQSTKTKKG